MSLGRTVLALHAALLWPLRPPGQSSDNAVDGADPPIEDRRLPIHLLASPSQRDTITVRASAEHEAFFFKVPADGSVPVIEIRRTGFDQSGRPLRLTVSAYPADRNKFVLSTTNPSAATHEPSVDLTSAEFNAVRRTDSLPGHAFISYVREDSRLVDQLQQTLEAAGVPVWRDTADLWPGENWRAKIRRAITDNALVFIACFSQTSISRRKSYQNEELALAIEEMRLRPPDEPWLIPVRLSKCEIPDREIGAGRTLMSIQRLTCSVIALTRTPRGSWQPFCRYLDGTRMPLSDPAACADSCRPGRLLDPHHVLGQLVVPAAADLKRPVSGEPTGLKSTPR